MELKQRLVGAAAGKRGLPPQRTAVVQPSIVLGIAEKKNGTDALSWKSSADAPRAAVDASEKTRNDRVKLAKEWDVHADNALSA